jgi:3-methylcrotonyl-CoA carboxylase beta subunit
VKIRQQAKLGRKLTQEETAAIRDPIVEEYKRTSSAYYSTSELWDDGILDPVDTRNALGIGLSAALNTPIGEPRYGIFRM